MSTLTLADLLKDAPRDQAGLKFDAPWQARAFATMVALAEAGRFRWEEFQQRLIAEVQAGDGDPDHYYEHWLAAAEKLLAAKNLVAPGALQARVDDLRPTDKTRYR
ncbi:MAG: nitrile hydratase accessory protein [Dongiaceae bacterium]